MQGMDIQKIRTGLQQQIQQRIANMGLGDASQDEMILASAVSLLSDDAMSINQGVLMTNGQVTLRIRRIKKTMGGGAAFVPEVRISTDFQKVTSAALIDNVIAMNRIAQQKGAETLISQFVSKIWVTVNMLEQFVLQCWSMPGFQQAIATSHLFVHVSPKIACTIFSTPQGEYVINLDLDPCFKMDLKDDARL
jgi:hypothetical protein